MNNVVWLLVFAMILPPFAPVSSVAGSMDLLSNNNYLYFSCP